MSDEYTPTEEDVLSRAISILDDPGSDYPLHWLASDLRAYQAAQAEHDRRVRAEAWDEGWKSGWTEAFDFSDPHKDLTPTANPYRDTQRIPNYYEED